MKRRLLFHNSLLMLFFILSIARAQYQVYTWENFEDGRISQHMKRFHNANETNCAIVDYRELKKEPAYNNIIEGIARTECGNYGILVNVLPEECKKNPNGLFISLVSDVVLDRKKLHPNGRAIVQMDVFFPADLSQLPTTALLAVGGEDPQQVGKWSIYRVGINTRQQFFFSFVDFTKSSEALIYKLERLSSYNLKIPGWHRIQILFEGMENIYCYIDGVKTGFSPLKESMLNNFRMGMMASMRVTSKPRPCVLDNLSIQYCMEGDISLPESPWTKHEDKDVVMNPLLIDPVGTDSTQSPLRWFLTPQDAVEYNLTKKAPYIVYFHSPSVVLSQECNSILESDSGARDFLKKFVCVKNDINQLGGGTLAAQLEVFKVPAFVLLDNKGNKKGVVLYSHDSGWNGVVQKLQEFLKN